jgi:hypothetical protein
MPKPIFDPTHPVAAAVLPLRASAVEAAEKHVREVIESHLTALAAVNDNVEAYAPYPSSYGPGYLGQADFAQKRARYDFIHRITTTVTTYHRPGEPCFVKASEKGIERVVEQAREDAALAYDAFICKLIAKIGEASAATLEGSHVWGYSILTVNVAAGTQLWKTQQIVNFTKYGMPYLQWPSRKVKAA